MQTFITDFNMDVNAKNLDDKRLGKQRIEALQIADCFLVRESRWKNHPAVRMWKHHESFLIKVYLVSILGEWEKRGFKNTKCNEWWKKLYKLVKYDRIIIPEWMNKEVIESHRSNLVRKDPNHYSRMWPKTKNNLKYVWPI